METIKHWIRRAIIHKYFPEIWYSVENWLSERTGDQMLEIGTGRGVFTDAMVKDSWAVTSIDPSQESIERARIRVKRSGYSVHFQTGTPEALPFPAERFDAITCINYLEFSSDPKKVLAEAYRVLKPGGKGVVVVFRSFSFWALPWVAAALRKDIPERPYRCYEFARFSKLIIQSGFSIDSYRYRARYLPVQPSRNVLPWPLFGAIVASVRKPLLSEFQIKVPAKKAGIFHK